MPPKPNETPAERALRVQRLKAEVEAGNFYREAAATVDKIEASALARYAAKDHAGQRRVTTIFEDAPCTTWIDDPTTPEQNRALYAEFWTEQSRASAENARRERQWREGFAQLAVAVQNAPEEEPEETPAERTDCRRRGLLLAGAYLMTLLVGTAFVFGKWRGWWR